jgi:hypothetical protein
LRGSEDQAAGMTVTRTPTWVASWGVDPEAPGRQIRRS